MVKDNTAGSPMDTNLRWTNLTPNNFVKSYAEKGVKTSSFIIKQLLKKKGFGKRKLSKKGTIKDVCNRDSQFKYITAKKEEFKEKKLPILSIDTKKKEFIGNFYRDGKCYCQAPLIVYDHDFPSLADGVLIPHGIFDLTQNKGYISIGQSKDTSEFLVDNIKYHWQNNIQKDYQNAREMLLLMDGGGSNSCLHYIVKEDLQKLANELKMTINIAHYPAYCSKYNPIEHLLFPHIQRAWKGVVFKNYQIVKELIEKTTTKTGLKVVAWINEKVYKTGRKYAENFKENMTITFDEIIPKWNYVIKPL
ncbi:MAG: ISAzo13 family transposase [Arcicella sp.]|nr:ISAzo13 family transposase [Arcicella sp.]